MPEKLAKIARSESDRLPESSLYAALTHPKFLRGVRSLARYTLREGLEGGVAAYDNNGLVTISEPDIASLEDRRQSSGVDYLPMEISFAAGFENYNPDKLVMVDPETSRLPRSDVLLLVHTHPLESYGTHGRQVHDADEMLSPSLNDLEAYEELLRYSPNVAEGVLVTERGRIRVLLFKRSPTKDYQQFYKSLDSHARKARIIEAMHRGGINTAELTIGRSEQYQQDTARVVKALEA